MKYIGIDPGKQGGMAVIYNNIVVANHVMPVGGSDLDYAAMALWFKSYENEDVIACIEKVHAMPGQGVTSMFTFGFVTGIVHGILSAYKIPYYLVTPQAWKNEILAGTAKDKNAAIDYCLRAYPGTSLLATPMSRTPHSGIADAICIATYASRHY